MIRPALGSLVAGIALLVACAPVPDNGNAVAGPSGDNGSAAGTRPADQPNFFIVEGRISTGVECPIITTPDGKVYSLGTADMGYGPGDYVEIEAELADASFCMQGDGTLIVNRIEAADPSD